MQRIVLPILLMTAVALGLDAQPQHHSKPTKFDQKLEKQLKTGNSSDTVKVIIQSHDLASLPGKLSHAHAANVKTFGAFPGMAAEVTKEQLAAFAQDPAIDAISSDEPLETTVLSGTESITSSSGAAAALKQFAASGAGVGVAIIDSGISTKTPFFPNIVYSKDFTSSLLKDDPFGHGTHVAGIVGNVGEGPAKNHAGVAPSARLIDLRVLDNRGAGMTSSVIAAIDWAITNRNINGTDSKPLNIRVINLSLGHRPLEGADTDPLALECRKAVQAGIVVVAAAGNYGKDANGNTIYGGILTPGIEPSVITVGAVTTWGTASRSDDVVASYSSRGPTIRTF